MKTFNIIIPTVDDVKEFTDIANSYKFEINLVRDRYIIDAKSIMGLFCLDLTKPVTVEVSAEDEIAYQTFYESVKRYIVD